MVTHVDHSMCLGAYRRCLGGGGGGGQGAKVTFYTYMICYILWIILASCCMFCRLFMRDVCYAHIQYWVGCISWGFSGGVVIADGENAFANLPFC